MKILDERGNLFGVVNVVDALVVLFVFAVVVAGAALVFGSGSVASPGSSDDVETRYATVDLGSQPWYVIEQIESGDVDRTAGAGGNVTVTDVYVTPTENASTDGTTFVRVAVDGRLAESDASRDPVFEHRGERLLPGRTLTLDTETYTVNGRAIDVAPTGESLPTGTTRVVVEANVSRSIAAGIQTGASTRIDGHTVATVEHVETAPATGDRQRVLVGVELTTIELDGTPTFAGSPVVVGSQLPIRTDSYQLEGTVVRQGTVEPPETPTTETTGSE